MTVGGKMHSDFAPTSWVEVIGISALDEWIMRVHGDSRRCAVALIGREESSHTLHLPALFKSSKHNRCFLPKSGEIDYDFRMLAAD